ncbi:hypothetical protein PT2222_80020 [Paraburkholderia tropica]
MRAPSRQRVGAQERIGHIARRLAVEVHGLVHVLHHVVVERRRERVELRRELRIVLERLFAHDRHGVVRREEMLVVFERHDAEALHAAIGRVDEADLQLVVVQRRVDEARVHLLHLRTLEVHAVGFEQRLQAVGTIRELGVHAEHHTLRLGIRLQIIRELRDRLDAGLLREFAGQADRVGVVERGGIEPDEPARFVERLHALVHGFGAELVGELVVDQRRRARVIPHHVELAVLQRAAHERAAEARAHFDVVAARAQILRRDFGQHVLLGEVLRAEHDFGGERRGAGRETQRTDHAGAREASYRTAKHHASPP